MLEFVREREDGGREELLVRQNDEDVEIALLLPSEALDLQAHGDAAAQPGRNDALLQAFEGVSHFVYLAQRVRTCLPTTLLELELQAEVDKFVLLVADEPALDVPGRNAICETLFERVQFLHHAESEPGARYRLANTLAARYVRRLGLRVGTAAVRRTLTRFYQAGQTDKIRLAQQT